MKGEKGKLQQVIMVIGDLTTHGRCGFGKTYFRRVPEDHYSWTSLERKRGLEKKLEGTNRHFFPCCQKAVTKFQVKSVQSIQHYDLNRD